MAESPTSEALEEVRAAARAYGEALFRCDAGRLADLFDARCNLYGLDGGQVTVLGRDEWLARVASRERPDPAAPAPVEVEMVDATGPDTAVARVTVSAGGQRFRDYLNFLKADGAWRVIAKVWRSADDAAG